MSHADLMGIMGATLLVAMILVAILPGILVTALEELPRWLAWMCAIIFAASLMYIVMFIALMASSVIK